MALTLDYGPLSSFCWKALIALYEADIAFEARQVNLRDSGDRAAFEAIWSLAKFPVLRDESRGKTVSESSFISPRRLDCCPRIRTWPSRPA